MSDERLSPERLAEIETSACNANDREHPHRGGEQVAVIALGVWELLSEVKAAWADTERLIAEVARLERELDQWQDHCAMHVGDMKAESLRMGQIRRLYDLTRAERDALAGQVTALRDALARIVWANTSGVYCSNCGGTLDPSDEQCDCIIELGRAALAAAGPGGAAQDAGGEGQA